MQDFRGIRVWQRAHQLTLSVYEVTRAFPNTERFGLTVQTRRAASSIPMNIAEGSVRSTDPDFARFLHIALGSASELDYQLLLARDLGYLDQTAYDRLSTETSDVRRMLNAFIRRLKTSERPP
jgi:four helix bundle protein